MDWIQGTCSNCGKILPHGTSHIDTCYECREEHKSAIPKELAGAIKAAYELIFALEELQHEMDTNGQHELHASMHSLSCYEALMVAIETKMYVGYRERLEEFRKDKLKLTK